MRFCVVAGYDRHATYGPRAASPSSIDVLSDYDDDSDVTVVSTNMNAFQRPVFEVIEIDSDSSHDSDVIIQVNRFFSFETSILFVMFKINCFLLSLT